MRTTLYELPIPNLGSDKIKRYRDMVKEYINKDLNHRLGEDLAAEILDTVLVHHWKDHNDWAYVLARGKLNDEAEAIIKLQGKSFPMSLLIEYQLVESQEGWTQPAVAISVQEG